MKWFTRSSKAVAYVGADKPISQRDMTSINIAKAAAPEFFPQRPSVEIISLAYGRDFLAETSTYDAVIVFSIFNGRNGNPESRSQVSPLSSLENWRRRLAGTGARIIAVLSLIPYSLDGWQLDEIPGYEITARNKSVTIYRRL